MKLFKKIMLLGLMSMTIGQTSFADLPFRQHRYDSFKVLPECKDGDIVFIGNSITHCLNWFEALGSHQNIHGRGNSGALSAEILDNVESMIVGNPSKVFLMIGTNDLPSNDAEFAPARVAERIEATLQRILDEAPNATVYYQSILPSTNNSRSATKITSTNNFVETWINNQHTERLVYVDLYNLLVGVNGALNNSQDQNANAWSFDGLHLTQKGYRIWLEEIHKYLGDEYEIAFPADCPNLWGGLSASNGMRVTYFGALPIAESDILLIGDETIHGGEWHELLGSPDFKDRGIGWGFPSVTISQLNGTIDAILKGNNTLVTKKTPKAVALYAGMAEVNSEYSATSILSYYQSAINSIRTRLPETDIFVMTLLPFASNGPTKAALVRSVNESIRSYAAQNDKIHVVDFYNVTTNADVRIEEYFSGMTENYLSGLGYARVANEMAAVMNKVLNTEYKAISMEEARANIMRYNLRKTFFDNRADDGSFATFAPSASENVDKTNGTMVSGTGSAWCNKWTSTDGLLTFSASANNMQWTGNDIDARSGTIESSNYYLECDSKYKITGFTITLQALSNDQNWTINGEPFTVTTSSVTKTYSDLDTQKIDFVLSGKNSGTLITKFAVSLEATSIVTKVDRANGAIVNNAWDSNQGPVLTVSSTTADITPNGAAGITIAPGDDLSRVALNVERGYTISGYTFNYETTSDVTFVVNGREISGKDGNVFVGGNTTSYAKFYVKPTTSEVNLSNFYIFVTNGLGDYTISLETITYDKEKGIVTFKVSDVVATAFEKDDAIDVYFSLAGFDVVPQKATFVNSEEGPYYEYLFENLKPETPYTAIIFGGFGQYGSGDFFKGTEYNVPFETEKDDESGINSVSIENEGEVLYYNLQGIRVYPENMTPGLYIANGKKVYVK